MEQKGQENKKYSDLITIENLFQAWKEFRKGKKKRKDLQVFERHLEDNLFALQNTLQTKTYRHGDYQEFYVHDPKKRHIHKASVADRVVHHLFHTYLYALFNPIFIYDSYSCRLEKGTHKGVLRLKKFARTVSKNYKKDCWALKLDIKKFFANVDHKILKDLLRKKIKDRAILWLLDQVIDSFCTCHPVLDTGFNLLDSRFRGNDKGRESHKGIPLGNLTSQVFANIYMNKLDQFVKHKLKVKYYLRYADDFVILDADKKNFDQYTNVIKEFLMQRLKLELNPKKIIVRELDWGIEFLGYIVLPHYILPRTKTKRRILRKIQEKLGSENFGQVFQSYLGYFSHGNTYKLTQELKNQVWFWQGQM